MDRNVVDEEIGYFLNDVTERGVIVSIKTAGSGVGLDNSANVCTVAATASGQRPLGFLLNDFVNNDLTRVPLNWYKDQSQIGSKASILKKGWVVTNKVLGTPKAGDYAVLGASGYVLPVTYGNATNNATNPVVGKFDTTLSEDGFARVSINLA